ncbi:uncharacterized protein LOC119355831 isoform X2 [Triticum dicoccoides]|uniref:uncharacterized protein LOC119355831 isoform X2 n=1 Tax=Triticum dicoccoides TaxID=85692 RepID=UPI0018903BCB|nr:uncharacterized protein LOC119355831 isoform X2 [Triticum dicoccoides]
MLELPGTLDASEIQQTVAALAVEKLPGPSIGNTSTPTTRFSVGSILYPVVRSTGLGSFLTVRVAGKMNRRFYARVLSRLDPKMMGMAFPDGQVRYLDKDVVSRITGIVSRPRPVKFGPLADRAQTVEKVQSLLGLDVRASAGVKVRELQKLAQICDPDEMSAEQLQAARIAYTLLVCCTKVDLKSGQASVPDELLACVEDPSKIGEYDWAGYILTVTRRAAEKFKADLLSGAKTYSIGGCNLPVQTKPEGSMVRLSMRWYPLIVPSIEVVLWTGPVEVEQGMHSIMSVLEDHVRSMLVDAILTVVAETNEANRSSVVDELMRQADDKMKKPQFCFGSKLYLGAVSTSAMIRPLSCVGSSSSSGHLVVGSSSCRSVGAPAEQALICGPVAKHGEHVVFGSGAVGEDDVNLKMAGLCGEASPAVGIVFNGLPETSLSPELHGSIPTLVLYTESEEEVSLPDDDIAFCLQSMFASPGGPSCVVGATIPSTTGSPVRTMVARDEEYARELEKKLESKEVEADNVVEDPLGVAAKRDKQDPQKCSNAGSSAGSHMVVVEDMRTLNPLMAVPAQVATCGNREGGGRGVLVMRMLPVVRRSGFCLKLCHSKSQLPAPIWQHLCRSLLHMMTRRCRM